MTIYLDTCALQRPFDDQSQPRVALEAEAVLELVQLIEEGDLDLLSSEVLLLETEQNPHPKRRAFAFDVLGQAPRPAEINAQIQSRARAYEETGVHPTDAMVRATRLHLAAAVEAGADVFCTTDDLLHRRGRKADTKSTAVLTPIELIGRIEL